MQNIHSRLLYTAKIKKRSLIPSSTITIGEYKVNLSVVAILISVVVVSIIMSLLFQSWSIVSYQKKTIQTYKEQIEIQALTNIKLKSQLDQKNAELSLLDKEFKSFKTEMDETIQLLTASVDKTLKDLTKKK